MAEARTLSVRVAVDRRLDVTVSVPPGITCVLGPSGAGKSTLLGAIAGLLRPEVGRIALGDEVWFDAAKRVELPANLRRVAYVFQHLALFPHFDAVGNVSYGMARTLTRAEKHERARVLLAKLGVGHLAHRKPRTFSGGEAQRVALARALAMEPQVILLDEPFSALDRTLRSQLTTLVRDLVAELEVPMVHVTHHVGEARALANRVVHLERGQVIAEGSPDEVLGKRTRDDMDDEVGTASG